MAKNKKLTIEQLIGARSNREKFATKDIYVESLGGMVTISKCKYDVILGAMDRLTKDSNMTSMLDVFKELLYKSIAIFRNDELLKAYEIAEPFDIVTELLELGEIMTLGNEVLKLYGFDGLEDEIKN